MRPFAVFAASLAFVLPLAAAIPPPGIVIDASPEPATSFVGSPSIVILGDGSYLASHDFFGAHARLGRRTRVFRSADRGRSWSRCAELEDQTWSTLFVHAGAVYLIGADREYGDIVLRRSVDGGRSWTTPADAGSGRLFPGRFHCGPTPVLEFHGRIWRAFERYGGPDGSWSGRYFHPLVISAPADRDLLQAANWTRSNDLAFDGAWVPGNRTGWLEGNVVPTPEGGLADVLRVNAPPGPQDSFELAGPAAGIPRFELAARVAIDPVRGTVAFDPHGGFFRFLGSQSKFTIRWDPVSRRYWALVNEITQPEPGSGAASPENQRNVLTLTSSADLAHWEKRCVILRWHEGQALTARDKVAFQYPDWQFDGADLVAVLRTSWNGASYHNANFLTFERVPRFRILTAADSPAALAGPN